MVRTALVWVLIFVVCLACQSTLAYTIAFGRIRPDFVVLALFTFGMRHGVSPGIFVGFLVGLTQDLYAPSILGQYALAKTLTGFFSGIFNEKIIRTDPPVKAILLCVSFLIHDGVFLFSHTIIESGGPGSIFSELLFVSLPRTAYSLAFAGLFSLLFFLVKPTSSLK